MFCVSDRGGCQPAHSLPPALVSFQDAISLRAVPLWRPPWPDFVKFTAKKFAWKKKRTHLLSQSKNNTNANYFECDIHPHIVQSYWQQQVPFNQRCHINWQQGFQRLEAVPSDTSASLSDGFINHPPGFEKDPLLLWNSFNWDVTGESLVVGTHGNSISFSLPVHVSTRKLANTLLCLDYSTSQVTHTSFNTLTSIFLWISHTSHLSAFSNRDHYWSPSVLRFGAQMKWRRFIRALMYMCELLNEILLVRSLSLEVGLSLSVRYVKCTERVEIKYYRKPEFANCILEWSSKGFYLSF